MICISVTPESRRLARADLLNASRQGDLIELCLDHLVKSPGISDLLDAVEKPIQITCRRSLIRLRSISPGKSTPQPINRFRRVRLTGGRITVAWGHECRPLGVAWRLWTQATRDTWRLN